MIGYDPEKARRVLELSLGEYSRERSAYWAKVYDIVFTYLKSSRPSTAFKQQFKKAEADTLTNVGEIAWLDGGSELPLDETALGFMAAKQTEDFGAINVLFENLQLLKKETKAAKEDMDAVAIAEATARADGYARTMDSVYSTVKLLGGKDKMLTFVGIDGQPPSYPCRECRRYKGKRHRASWWVAHDAIPGSHTGFTCKGYNCKHVLIDDGGQLWTL